MRKQKDLIKVDFGLQVRNWLRFDYKGLIINILCKSGKSTYVGT